MGGLSYLQGGLQGPNLSQFTFLLSLSFVLLSLKLGLEAFCACSLRELVLVLLPTPCNHAYLVQYYGHMSSLHCDRLPRSHEHYTIICLLGDFVLVRNLICVLSVSAECQRWPHA